MSRRKISAILVAALTCCTIGARADELDKPILSFDGYGTLGLTHSSESQADFTANYVQPNGAGYSRSWSADVDSRLGLQANGNFNTNWSAVVQVISQQRYDGTYTPTLEWANVKYQLNPDLSVRAGRIALPIFLTADYRNVGFAIPWVRPPGELYNLVPITNSDGLDIRYRMHFGDLSDTIQAEFGKTKIDLAAGGVKVNGMRGLSNTLDLDALTVRLTYLQANLNVDLAQSLFEAFNQFGPQGAALTAEYGGADKPITYMGIGINYDPGTWFVMAELGNTRTHTFLGAKTAGYVTLGYRWKKFTPYITYAQVNANSNRSDPGLALQGLPPQLAAEAAALNAGLNQLLGSISIQKSVAIGVRWDLMKNTALKAQYNFIHLGDGSPGDFGNTQPGFVPGGKAGVASVVLDFVF